MTSAAEFEPDFSDNEETEIRTALIKLQEKVQEAKVPVVL